MWSCPKCGRVFGKAKQPHSCRKVELEKHFENKMKARELFDFLVERMGKEVGEYRIVSIPCCVHLFGRYEFLAVLPKRDGLEIRFALDRKIDSSRLKVAVPMSKRVYKNCFDIRDKGEVDEEFLRWLRESYHLKD